MSEKQVPFHKERTQGMDPDELKKAQGLKRRQLVSDMSKTFGPVEGRRVLRYLLDLCGYKKSKVGGNPTLGMDILTGTLYNTAREQVALELIEYLPKDILKDVEFGTPNELLE